VAVSFSPQLLDERTAALSQRPRLWAETETFRRARMRDIEVIDSELRLLFRAWRVARVLCDRMPSTALIDELLDERLAQRGGSLAGLVKQLVN
jgi:hypothetical protein